MKNIAIIIILLLANNSIFAQVVEHDFGEVLIRDVILENDEVKFITSSTYYPDSTLTHGSYYYNKIVFASGKVIDFGKKEGIISANENTIYTGSSKDEGINESFLCEYNVNKNSIILKRKVKIPDNVFCLVPMQNSKGDFLEYDLDENYGQGVNFYSSDLKLLSSYKPYVSYQDYEFKFNKQFMLMKVQRSRLKKNISKLALFDKETLKRHSEKEIILDEGFYITSTFLDDTNIYITANYFKDGQYKRLLQKYDFDMNCVWETEKISRPHRKLYFDRQNKYMYGTGCPIEKIDKNTGEITTIEFPDFCKKIQKKKNEPTVISDLFIAENGEIKVLVFTSEIGSYESKIKDLRLFTFSENVNCIDSINILEDEYASDVSGWPFFISHTSTNCRIFFNSKIIKI